MTEIDSKVAVPPMRSGTREVQVSCDVAIVKTTARLHFGFLDPSGRGPRPFGSFGLSLDRPRTKLRLTRASAFKVHGPESERAARYLRAIAESCGATGAYDLDIEEAIAPHAGLGSGTQLALAVGSAFATLEGLELSPQEIATRLGRGTRSGIGIATFEMGGVVLDDGPGEGWLPPLLAQVPFPADWRVLLIFDCEEAGLAGASETAAFDALPEFPESEASSLRERILRRALPALAEQDFDTFCTEVGSLQERMGAYFAPLQGGPYTSHRVAGVLDWLRGRGVTGLGQSSWGPTGFAFAESEQDGQNLLAAARSRDTKGLRFELAKGRNEGAEIAADAEAVR